MDKSLGLRRPFVKKSAAKEVRPLKRTIFSAALALCCLVLCLFLSSCEGERVTTDDGASDSTAVLNGGTTSAAPDETTTPAETTTDTSFDTSFPNTPEPDGTKRY